MTAISDGFAIVQLSAPNRGDRGVVLVTVNRKDGSTEEWRISAHHCPKSEAWIKHSCLTIPVAEGENWTAILTNEDRHGSPLVLTRFFSF